MSTTHVCFFFFFNDTATTEIYPLSLHDALPIWGENQPRALLPGAENNRDGMALQWGIPFGRIRDDTRPKGMPHWRAIPSDRKSTRLNSSHMSISYAVFCLKKKNKQRGRADRHTL